MEGASVPLRVGPSRLSVSIFQVCGLVGLAAAVAVALGACSARALSFGVETAIILVSIAVFFVLAFATKAVTGAEALIYYHHEIAVLCAAAGLAALLGAPVLGHLDATALGLGAFLACGRVGCLSAGCCHGRPAARGVQYGAAHVAAGFPGYLSGRTVLPVQAIEAGGVAALVLAGLVLVPDTPGAAFGFYVSGYAVLRFGLEMLRGDPQRPYWHGLSEAQWTSLFVALAITALAAARLVPGLVLHAICAAALVIALPFAVRPPRRLLDPRHVRELAVRLTAPHPGAEPRVGTTSLGIQVSVGLTGHVTHVTVSRRARALSADETDALARVVQWLTAHEQQPRVQPGAGGAVHLLFQAADRKR
ncbi:MAG: prolipoprotein diacylglyceryl transferase family protein [Solirubrobacteraceae bacterium]